MRTTARTRIAAPLMVAAALTFTACSGGSSDSGTADAPMAGSAAGEKPAPEADVMRDGAADSTVAQSQAYAVDTASLQGEEAPDSTEQAIISKGVVSLLGDDVAAARFDVQKIVDARGGEVEEEKTQTDEDGEVSRSRLVVRIPVAEFDAAMEALEEVAQLESSNRSSEDVTTQVIDTRVRIRAQEQSLRRVEVLLGRARSIRDIVSIESQLTRRQADLDSLKSQMAYLTDQTSMSTITVFLEKKPEKLATTEKKEEATGFLAGLSDGWHGLTTFLVAMATLLGTLLPFAVLFGLLGVPAWVLLKRFRAGRSARTPSVA